MRPEANEYGTFHADYVSRVPETDIVAALKAQRQDTLSFLRSLSEQQSLELKGTNAWAIKQVVEHLCDAERVFAYRALRFSRGDQTALASFKQDDYVANGRANESTLESLVEQYDLLRQATILLAESMTPEMMQRRGIASGTEVSVRALFYVTVGHDRRHLEIMKNLNQEALVSC